MKKLIQTLFITASIIGIYGCAASGSRPVAQDTMMTPNNTSSYIYRAPTINQVAAFRGGGHR